MGLFAVVNTNISIPELKRKKNIAEDAWEHEGPYLIVPKDADIVSALIASETDHGAIELPEKYAKAIDGMGEGDARTTSMTGKASIALFFLGRYLFGNEWYQNELHKHRNHIELNYKCH